ncbi:MAG: hypothetical protein WC091_20025 [Sulfuricellaceae bacterium]
MNSNNLLVAGATALSLCAGTAQAVNLLDLSKWDVYGTASSNQGALTFGDNVGYDTADTDKDGNPSNVWNTGSVSGEGGYDYDWAASKDAFAQPATLAFSGCLSSTAYGYQYFGLSPTDSRFTGQFNSSPPVDWGNSLASFLTRWESKRELRTVTTVGGKQTQSTVAGAQPSGGNYCGEYRIEWHDNVADYYYNNAKVGSQALAYSGTMKVFSRNFEKPFTITAISFTGAPGITQASTKPLNVTQYVAGMVGSFTGALTDSNGVKTNLTGKPSVDVSISVDAVGNITADITGAMGASGVYINFAATFNSGANNLTGTYTDGHNTTPKPIAFTSTGDLKWHVALSGTLPDGKAYSVAGDIELPAAAIKSGAQFAAGQRLAGPITHTEPLSIPINIPELGISDTLTTSVIVDGSWSATPIVQNDGTVAITGEASGEFRFSPPISKTYTATVTPPYPGIPPISIQVPINIDVTGAFGGTLSGNPASGNLKFVGNWSENSSAGKASGSMDIDVPIDPVTGQVTALKMKMGGALQAPPPNIVLPSGIPTGMIPTPGALSIPNNLQPSIPFVMQ